MIQGYYYSCGLRMPQSANGPRDPGAAGNQAGQTLEMFHTALVSPLVLTVVCWYSFPELLNLEPQG